jgi:hypothetical protein
MDIRMISGAAYSGPPLPVVAGASTASPLDGNKSTSTAAPYLSPVYRFDPVSRLAILSYRDPTSGTVTQQFPSEKVVEQYRRTRGESPDAVAAAAKQAQSANSGTGTGTGNQNNTGTGTSAGIEAPKESGASRIGATATVATVSAPAENSATAAAATATPSPATASPTAARVSLSV